MFSSVTFHFGFGTWPLTEPGGKLGRLGASSFQESVCLCLPNTEVIGKNYNLGFFTMTTFTPGSLPPRELAPNSQSPILLQPPELLGLQA